MATIGFKGFGWILGLATVSPACYMVSSQVAAERGKVESVERAILAARHDIRSLETEFDTRANLAQLERWNGDVLRMSAPRPEQYVPSESALAALRPLSATASQASLVVPAAVMIEAAVVVPAVAPVATPAPAPAPAAGAAPAVVPAAPAAAPVRAPVATAAAAGRITKVAMLDRKLLSDSTVGDLVSSARAERAKLR